MDSQLVINKVETLLVDHIDIDTYVFRLILREAGFNIFYLNFTKSGFIFEAFFT